MDWRFAIVATLLLQPGPCSFAASGKECFGDVVLETIYDVQLFAQKKCSVLRGSLYLFGLEPFDFQVGYGECYSSERIRSLDLPSIDSVTVITGGLGIFNLVEGYGNLSQLLPNLKYIRGEDSVLVDYGYPLAVSENLYFEDLGEHFQLENGCVYSYQNSPNFHLNLSRFLHYKNISDEEECRECPNIIDSLSFPGRFCEHVREKRCVTSGGQNVISSKEDMDNLEGCTFIEGGLVLSRLLDVSDADLRKYLGQIKVVQDYVVVFHAYNLKSLDFFSNLEAIEGKTLWDDRYALAIFSNEELSYLWPGIESLNLSNGQALIHHNTVLCQQEYDNLVLAVGSHLRGNLNSLEGLCLETAIRLDVNVSYIGTDAATVSWQRTSDERYKVLGYEVFYQEQAKEDRQHCGVTGSAPNQQFGGWRVETVDGNKTATTVDFLEPETYYWIFIRSSVLILNETVARQTQEYADGICFKTKPKKLFLPVRKPSIVFSPPPDTESPCRELVFFLAPHAPYNEERNDFLGYIMKVTAVKVDFRISTDGNATEADDDDDDDEGSTDIDFSPSCSILRHVDGALSDEIDSCINSACTLPHVASVAEDTGAPSFCPCYDEPGIATLPVGQLKGGKNASSTSKISESNLTVSARYHEDRNGYEIRLGPARGATIYFLEVKTWLNESLCSIWSDLFVMYTWPIASDNVVYGLQGNGSFAFRSTLLVDLEWTNPAQPDGDITGYIVNFGTSTFSVLDSIQDFGSVILSDKNASVPCEDPLSPPKRLEGQMLLFPIASCIVSVTAGMQLSNLQYQLNAVGLSKYNFDLIVWISVNTTLLDGDEFFVSKTIRIRRPQKPSPTSRIPSTEANKPIKNRPNSLLTVAIAVPVALSSAILVLVLVIFLIMRNKRRKGDIKKVWVDLVNSRTTVVTYDGYESTNVRAYIPDDWEVNRKRISLNELLGEGAFGQVYKGTFQCDSSESRTVAVKMCKDTGDSLEPIVFLQEASVMKEFDSDYIVRLIGIVSLGSPVLVLMEIMELGDLKAYLRSIRPKEEEKDVLNGEKMILMATQIASGMAYLTERNFVHRDLAARNCMVAGDTTVKIGDFGMARDVQMNDYYRKRGKGPMPVRWMAPESLRDGVFTHATDVWSYGIVLWEIVTFGSLPYPGLSNEEVVATVGNGNSMDLNDLKNCPDLLLQLIKECWQINPFFRPSFLSVLNTLPALDGCEAQI